ncbi:LytTR family transcriptional regulator DNA-binding domain-containing protein [Tenacibaculum sp. 190524A05c]|uniref:ligand-binding sensor domain-containing protein n=1 Tax=Tenacibaculum platacis TaxID=3137852 RepID=UPI0032B23D88
MSSSEVYDITQDNIGYIWFATDRGLTRFDGKTFKRYTISEGLPDNTILNFYEQPNGNIWCTTINHKIFYFKNEKEGFCSYKYNELIKENISNNSVINNLAVTKENDLLLAFNNRDLFLRINNKGEVITKPIKVIARDDKINIKTLKDAPNFIFRDNSSIFNFNIDHSINCTFLTGASSFTGMINFPKYNMSCAYYKNWCFFIDSNYTIRSKEVPYHNSRLAIKAGKLNDNLLWIGYQYGGAIILDLKGNIKDHLLKDKSVTKVFKDHEGGLWVSTLNSGVYYCKDPSIKHYSFKSFPTELDKNDKGELFVAFHNGGVKKKLIHEKNFTELYSSKRKYPVFIGYDKKNDQLYIEELNSKKVINQNLEILKDQVFGISDDELFTHSFGKSYIRINQNGNKKEVKVPERIYDISKNNESVLIGTQGGLYEYYNSKLNSLTEESPLLQHRITDIDVKKNQVYITTMGKGIVIKQRDTIFAISKKDGLLSDICTEVYVEDPYTLWVGTNRGINRIILYKNNTYDIDRLSYDEGLVCSEILDIEIVNKTLWVASREGLFSIPSDIFDRTYKTNKNYLHVNKVTLDDKEVKIADELAITPSELNMKIHFNTISFKNQGRNEYRYKLKEDEDWSYTYNTSIDLSHLQYGSYRFILQAKDINGLWNESIEKDVVVMSPFWMTKWFMILILFLTGSLIFIFFKYRVLIFNKNHFLIIYHGILNKLRRSQNDLYVSIKANGSTIKLVTSTIGYFKSSRNYLEIYTENKKYVVRKKLDDFYNDLPDLIEYTKVHRSYYVRLDKISEIKGNKEVYIFNNAIPVSKTYADNLKRFSA